MTVAELLQYARQAHQRYSQARGRINRDGKVSKPTNLLQCGQAIREALAARTEAQALDPRRTEMAWLEDAQEMQGVSSDTLVEFYAQYLARDVAA